MIKLRGKFVAMFVSFMILATTVYADAEVSVTPSENQSGMYSVTGDSSSVPSLLAESAIVVDMKTGYTLVEKNIYDKHYPASITKIMTAILTLEQVDLNETVTFSHDAVYSVEAGSSAAYVDVDEKLTVEQCLYGLMLISGNDLANGLAEHVGGSMTEFANMMTNKAKEIGCLNTNFTNAHGLHDENHYTTAYDMALIAKYAYDNLEKFREICKTGYYECPATNKQAEVRQWRNNNKLINEYAEQYYPDCIGGKTGFTNQAGGTFVSYANINGREIMCVIMKSTNSAGAYEDATKLYEYVRNNVTEAMYASLEEKYKAANADVPEAITGSEEQTTDIAAGVEKTKPDTERDDAGMWIGWKILILAVTVLIIYYAYVRYMRYLNRKRREARRRNRK